MSASPQISQCASIVLAKACQVHVHVHVHYTAFILIITIFNFGVLSLVTLRYAVHYEWSQNANFLVLITM